MTFVVTSGPRCGFIPSSPPPEFDWSDNSPGYLPIIPGAAGYGMDTVAGSGRHSISGGLAAAVTIHFVTNLNLSGTGSLKAALQATGPRIIIPTVSGVVNYTGQAASGGANQRQINITDGRFIYAGQCAPAPGLALRACLLAFMSANTVADCLFWHFTSFQDLYTEAELPASRGDCVQVAHNGTNPKSKIVFANCDLLWGSDEIVDLSAGVIDCTVWQSIIAEGLQAGNIPAGSAGYGLIAGAAGTGLSVLRNVFAHTRARNPLTRHPTCTIANNLTYNYLQRGVELQNENSVTSQTNVEGNIFVDGPDSLSQVPVYRSTSGVQEYLPGSTFYLANNRALGWSDTTQAGLVSSGAGTMVGSRITAAYPAGYTVTTGGTREEMARLVMRDAGARPASRISQVQRVIDHAEARLSGVGNQGGMVDTPTDAGGFPSLANNSVDHTQGADPIPGITTQSSTPTTLGTAGRTIMASDYTAIEEWLYRKHVAVMP